MLMKESGGAQARLATQVSAIGSLCRHGTAGLLRAPALQGVSGDTPGDNCGEDWGVQGTTQT